MWFWEKPQVFVCHIPGNPKREQWLRQCTDAWYEMGMEPHVLTPGGIDPLAFQRERRLIAERMGGKFYILADDDCLPLCAPEQEFVQDGFSILKNHPEYAMLAPLPTNENIVEWTPSQQLDKYAVQSDDEVMEHVSIGGIRFCRKGCLKGWPQITKDYPGYDGKQGEALRKAGWRVGYMRNLNFEHLGAGQSTVWRYNESGELVTT